MKIGYAQTVLTPSLERPVFLAGFGNNRLAQSIHDDLYARALVISDGPLTMVLCALDLVGFFQPDIQKVLASLKGDKDFQKLEPQVIIASTHTHHGPDSMGLWGLDQNKSGVDAVWLAKARTNIENAILAALSDLQPASFKSASIHVPGLAKNARDPQVLDDELTVIQFLGLDGKPLVSVFDFPCHPEVLWENNPHVSSDYPGFLRTEVERQTGSPCVFFAGALGGMMTPDVKDHSFTEAEFMGNKLARAGLTALAEAQIQTGNFSLSRKVIRARLTNPLYKLAFWRKLLPDVRDRQGFVTSEINLLKLGGLWLVTIPGELLPKLGLAIKAQLRKAGAQNAGIICLANDELGYILPVEDFKYPWNPFNPGKHYEETNSIGKDIAPQILAGIATLLK